MCVCCCCASCKLPRSDHTSLCCGTTNQQTTNYHQVESDPLSKDPDRLRVHSSMYRGLTTNLPRGVMGFSDLPFSPAAMGMRMGAAASMDARRFPCSEEVGWRLVLGVFV